MRVAVLRVCVQENVKCVQENVCLCAHVCVHESVLTIRVPQVALLVAVITVG